VLERAGVTLSSAAVDGKDSWSSEQKELLRKLWEEGMSAARIAAKLSETGPERTKNAVVSQVHRMQLVGRPSPIKLDGPRPPRPPRPVKTLPPLPPPPEPAVAVAPPAPPPRAPVVATAVVRAPLAPSSAHRACQWPMNNAPPWVFCGAPREAGRRLPYCAEHYQRAVQPPRDRSGGDT
jgi:GcrA cell cycle regulator